MLVRKIQQMMQSGTSGGVIVLRDSELRGHCYRFPIRRDHAIFRISAE